MIVRGQPTDYREAFMFTIEPFTSGGFRLDIEGLLKYAVESVRSRGLLANKG